MYEEMILLVSRLAEYLRMSEQQLRCFHKYESQIEGWFKGELICFLDREKRTGRLPDFKQEKKVYVGDTRNQVDMALQFDKSDSSPLSWVELKHWIGHQNNRDWTPSSYFLVPSERSESCAQCVKKLLTIPETIPEAGKGIEADRSIKAGKFMLVLFTKNPDSEKWNSGVEDFNTRFPPLSVRSLTNPSDYPDYFFLGLLHVSDLGQH